MSAKMKMSPVHYEALRTAIEPLDTPQRRDTYRNAGRTDERYRWDLFYTVRPQLPTFAMYQYLNDSHIDTALRRIIPPLPTYAGAQ